jgi:CRISPR/Cas system-associated exonuclease Cas4 (RecB family)
VSILSQNKFRHSASSSIKIKNESALFVADKIIGIKQPYGDAAIRGNVGEPLGRYLMAKDITKDQAWDYAKKKFQKLGGKDTEELKFAYNCSYQIAEELQSRQMKRPDEYQERVWNDGKDFGLNFPIVGFLDFSYHKNYNMVVDIKTTKRVPSKPNKDHILQQSLYWKLTGEKRRFALLYCSDKRANFIEIKKEELQNGWEEMLFNMRFIERMDKQCKSKEDWLLSFPYPSIDSFYYNDENFKQQIINLYKGVITNG